MKILLAFNPRFGLLSITRFFMRSRKIEVPGGCSKFFRNLRLNCPNLFLNSWGMGHLEVHRKEIFHLVID